MSANFVSTGCIDRIITAMRTARAVVGLHEMPTAAECSKVGQIMLMENARSLCACYRSIGDGERGEMESVANSYRYDIAAHPLPAMSDDSCAMLVGRVLFDGLTNSKESDEFAATLGADGWAALGEFDYQACEAQDYRETAAGKLVEAINTESIAALALMLPAITKAASVAALKKADADKVEMKNAVDRAIAENPHLIPGGRDVVEKNIRAALKLEFPGVKFSVRKLDYSATSINWTDGPTTAEVDAIVNRHLSSSFDGMTDGCEYRTSAFCEAFGGVRYVSTSRDHSDSAMSAAIQAVAVMFCVAPISLDELRRNGWMIYPMAGERDPCETWLGIVNRLLAGTYE